MPINYPNMKSLAVRLIGENGVDADMARDNTSEAGYDPVTDEALGPSRPLVWPVSVLLSGIRSGDDDFDWQTYAQTYEINRITKAYIPAADGCDAQRSG